nr:hypothetical protein [Halomonas sp.]
MTPAPTSAADQSERRALVGLDEETGGGDMASVLVVTSPKVGQPCHHANSVLGIASRAA